MLAKLIPINELPEGGYKEQLALYVQDPNTAVWIVAKEGLAGDWAAYIGWPNLQELKPQFQNNLNHVWYCEHVHEISDVLEMGDKLSEHEARVIFPLPVHAKLRYRR